MSYMLLIHEPIGQRAERGEAEGRVAYDRMVKWGASLKERGVLVASESLKTQDESSARLQVRNGRASVLDGPFAEAKELVGGFWIWQVSSMDEAVEWLKRAPFKGTSVELRRVAEPADFEGKIPQELIDAEQRLRDQSGQQG